MRRLFAILVAIHPYGTSGVPPRLGGARYLADHARPGPLKRTVRSGTERQAQPFWMPTKEISMIRALFVIVLIIFGLGLLLVFGLLDAIF